MLSRSRGGTYDGSFGGGVSDTSSNESAYDYSIRAAGAISSTRFIIHSDERMNDIVDVEYEALVKLRKLHLKKNCIKSAQRREHGAHLRRDVADEKSD